MKCHICNSNLEVGKCIVCKKGVCHEKHAELFWIDLNVKTDSGHYLESDKYSLTFYCCLEGHSRWEVQNALREEFKNVPKKLKYKKEDIKEDEHLLKILIVGGSATGNTTMLERLMHNRFDPKTRRTIGTDFSKITLQLFNKDVKIQLWDFAGSKHMEFLWPNYYAGSDSMMVIFDLTRAQTITNLDNIVESAKNAGIESDRILLVGNKSDLTDQIVISDDFALDLVELIKL